MTGSIASPLPHVSLPALLGLRDGSDPDLWARIRAAQLLAGRQRALLLLAAHLIGAAMVADAWRRAVDDARTNDGSPR